jgi:dihydroneopterin aldolase
MTETRVRMRYNLGKQATDSHERDLTSYNNFCAALQRICNENKVTLFEHPVKYSNGESFTVKYGDVSINKDIYKELRKQWPDVTVERSSTQDTITFKYKKSDLEISKQQYNREWLKMIIIFVFIILLLSALYAT